MALAIEQARLALSLGEVPVGAVVVQDGKVVGQGHNATVSQNDPCAHAEVVALRQAGRHLGNYRLDDCDLYVTLEPCIMCCGAILHARVRQVVFGAADPKTGAAGSVMNAFADPRLNHHTEVLGGVHAQACAQLLTDFFQSRRRSQRQARRLGFPLRDDAVRTPDTAFAALSDYPWAPQYVSHLPSLQGLRLHFLDEGGTNASRTIVLLHDCPAWSYLFRHAIPLLVQAGYRVVAPDLIGFGKSDKPKHERAHSVPFHAHVVDELIEHLRLEGVWMVVQVHPLGMGAQLASALAQPKRKILAIAHTPASTHKPLWMDAPFPNPGYRAALRACTHVVSGPLGGGDTVYRTGDNDYGERLVRWVLDQAVAELPSRGDESAQ